MAIFAHIDRVLHVAVEGSFAFREPLSRGSFIRLCDGKVSLFDFACCSDDGYLRDAEKLSLFENRWYKACAECGQKARVTPLPAPSGGGE